jgi:hypothetical protein
MLKVFAACANSLTLVAQEDEDFTGAKSARHQVRNPFLRRRLRLPSNYLTACFCAGYSDFGLRLCRGEISDNLRFFFDGDSWREFFAIESRVGVMSCQEISPWT